MCAQARDGLCKKDPNLFTTCPVSCGTCTHLCLDKQNDCPQWASENQCIDNPAFMLKECPHSCMVCNEMTHKAAKHPVDIEAKTADGRTMAPRAACGDSDRRALSALPRPPSTSARLASPRSPRTAAPALDAAPTPSPPRAASSATSGESTSAARTRRR